MGHSDAKEDFCPGLLCSYLFSKISKVKALLMFTCEEKNIKLFFIYYVLSSYVLNTSTYNCPIVYAEVCDRLFDSCILADPFIWINVGYRQMQTSRYG